MADERTIMEQEISNASQHSGNASSRLIFDNPVLTSQILRNYTEMSIFSEVQPEDIENVTEKYHAFLGVEFEADTVKKVRINTKDKGKNKGKGTEEETEKEVYVIPLVDHKSDVDYDVAMQLFRYMAVIWYDYTKKYEKEHENKSFRYPLILPIVYYEGKRPWTADLNFLNRIERVEGMKKYIPKFEYKVISCHAYTEEELREKHDEMSLIMLINRVQTPEEFHKFLETPKEYVEEVLGKTSMDIRKIISKVLWALLMKLNVPVNEAQKAVENVEVGKVGYLFENAEKMDIQEERRKTLSEKNRADSEKGRADSAENYIKSILSNIIKEKKQNNYTKEEVLQILEDEYQMKKDKAAELVEEVW